MLGLWRNEIGAELHSRAVCLELEDCPVETAALPSL